MPELSYVLRKTLVIREDLLNKKIVEIPLGYQKEGIIGTHTHLKRILLDVTYFTSDFKSNHNAMEILYYFKEYFLYITETTNDDWKDWEIHFKNGNGINIKI